MVAFLDLGEMPTQVGVQWPTAESARSCPRGRLTLAYCPRCEFIANVAFVPDRVDYGHPYDNTLGYSAVYQEYERQLVERLVWQHALQGKTVVEIGCGDGAFLRRLCEVGGNRGIGFDPSLDLPADGEDGLVRYVRDCYPGAHGRVSADFVACRQVFEHMPAPQPFLCDVRETVAASARGVVYFEVPNFDKVLREPVIWTMIYEHCSYYTPRSLARLFERSGYAILDVRECYDNAFVSIEATPSARNEPGPPVDDSTDIGARIEACVARMSEGLRAWEETLKECATTGQRVVAWGAGARAVTFLNALRVSEEVPYVVDINPGKHGKCVPGTGQRIVSPHFLTRYRPEVVIVLNSIYRSEIEQTIEDLGLQVRYLYA
jgi:SAM-dependent methyltransferase